MSKKVQRDKSHIKLLEHHSALTSAHRALKESFKRVTGLAYACTLALYNENMNHEFFDPDNGILELNQIKIIIDRSIKGEMKQIRDKMSSHKDKLEEEREYILKKKKQDAVDAIEDEDKLKREKEKTHASKHDQ